MVDIEVLRQSIRVMSMRSKLYKVLKDELSALGHWRNKARGNPQAGYKAGYGKHKGTLTI